jgi:2-polyprenyl-3-methyl-5-hydroxy-6-metoxy-1,4-benzoquinol methylase
VLLVLNPNPSGAAIASAHYDRIHLADIETFEFPYPEQFDCILFDVLEHLRDPSVIGNTKKNQSQGELVRMDIDWTLINRAKNLAERQIPEPILKIKIVADYRDPLVFFLRANMRVLDIGANNRSLKTFIDEQADFSVDYKSMDVDRTYSHDFYDFDSIQGGFEAITCFEVIEHMTPLAGLELLRHAHRLLAPKGRVFVSTPNVYHPMSFWSDSTHITPYRIRHLAGWMATAGFVRFWGFRVCRMTLRKRLRVWRYRGLLRLLNLDFAPGVVVIGEKA